MRQQAEDEPTVWVPVVRVEPETGLTPGARHRFAADGDALMDRLAERGEDLGRAVQAVTRILRESLQPQPEPAGDWQVQQVQAAVGLTFTAEAGVLLAKASTEGSITLTITLQRGGG